MGDRKLETVAKEVFLSIPPDVRTGVFIDVFTPCDWHHAARCMVDYAGILDDPREPFAPACDMPVICTTTVTEKTVISDVRPPLSGPFREQGCGPRMGLAAERHMVRCGRVQGRFGFRPMPSFPDRRHGRACRRVSETRRWLGVHQHARRMEACRTAGRGRMSADMSEEPFWRHVSPIELIGRKYRAVTDKAALN